MAVMIARNFGALANALGFPGMPLLADGPYSAVMALIFVGLPMVLWSLIIDKVHKRASTGIDWSQRRPVADVLDLSIIKIAGIWATWALIALIYFICRWYWAPPYDFSMKLFGAALVPLIIMSVPYVVWLDRHLVEPRDGSWHFGAWVAGRDDWQAQEIFHHLRAWAVKGFFLAFMFSAIPGGFGDLVRMDFAQAFSNPVALATALIGVCFLVDIQIATVGYMLTMKPLDAHIRTANPYLGSWVAALMCYPPFIIVNSGRIVDYKVNTAEWDVWFQGMPIMLSIWGALLVLLTAFYAWATMAFGLRFSNLTHRGILTNGPYAITKHPAYLSKNIFWWLSTMPFLVTSNSWTDAVRNTVMMSAVSGIYYWRAKTEERHLMADPVYAQYAAWMDRNALVPRFFVRLRMFAGSRLRSNTALSK
jgi:protein-S-isoprenylcysteine O-methyltransferase Ste14